MRMQLHDQLFYRVNTLLKKMKKRAMILFYCVERIKSMKMLAHVIVDFIRIFLVQSVEIDLKENHHFWNEHTVYGSSNLTWCLNGKKWQHFRICAVWQIEESLPLSRQIFQFWESDITIQHRHIKEVKRAKKSERWKRFKCVWMNEKTNKCSCSSILTRSNIDFCAS